jgi:hypothetical protein
VCILLKVKKSWLYDTVERLSGDDQAGQATALPAVSANPLPGAKHGVALVRGGHTERFAANRSAGQPEYLAYSADVIKAVFRASTIAASNTAPTDPVPADRTIHRRKNCYEFAALPDTKTCKTAPD